MFRIIVDFFLWVDSVVFFSEEKRIAREKRKVNALIKEIDETIAEIEARINEEG